MDFTDGASVVPASPTLAVSDEFVLTATNSGVQVFDWSGAPFPLTSPSDFFSLGPPECTSGLFYPDAVYDEEHERFVLAYLKGASSQDGGYCMAVSSTADPTGSWAKYFFPINTEAAWIESNRLGVGDDYILLGSNSFDFSGAFIEGRIYAFSKQALYSGVPGSPITRGLGSALSSPQPLHLQGWRLGAWPDHGNDLYVLSDLEDGRNYRIHRWNPANGAFQQLADIDLGASSQPINAPQSGGGLINVDDWKLRHFDYRNGFAWTSMTVGCNPGSGTRACVRWAQIDLSNLTLGPAGSGTIGSADRYRFFPAITANRCNDAVAAYTNSSNSTFPSLSIATRLSGEPPGQFTAESVVKAGEINYTAFDGSPYRWGTDTGIAMAPDGANFWVYGTYSKDTGTTTGRWGTYLVRSLNPACPVQLPDAVFEDRFESLP